MTLTYFTKQNKDLSYCDSDFENWLGEEDDTPVAENPKLQYADLPRQMTDKEILREYNAEPVSLGEIAYMLKNGVDLSDWNLFFVKDSKGSVFVVRAFKNSDGWNVSLYQLGHDYGWSNGYCVFFRTRSDTQPPSDTLPSTLVINNITYKRV